MGWVLKAGSRWSSEYWVAPISAFAKVSLKDEDGGNAVRPQRCSSLWTAGGEGHWEFPLQRRFHYENNDPVGRLVPPPHLREDAASIMPDRADAAPSGPVIIMGPVIPDIRPGGQSDHPADSADSSAEPALQPEGGPRGLDNSSWHLA